jgi:ribonuclease HII
MRSWEHTLKFKDESFIAGLDEVGRGPFAGPVVAACCYLEFKKPVKPFLKKISKLGINDSKKLTSKKREEIIGHFGFGVKDLKANRVLELVNSQDFKLHLVIKKLSHLQIDRINILEASMRAMSLAFNQCWNKTDGGIVGIDGNRIPRGINKKLDSHALVKGDSKSILIGLASIFAKEYRDYLMKRFDRKYPQYGFKSNAGYGTKFHREAIGKYGLCPIHRKSFKIVGK